MQALGPDVTRSALTNQDNYVSPRVSIHFYVVPSPSLRKRRSFVRSLPHRRRPRGWINTCTASRVATMFNGSPTYLHNRSTCVIAGVDMRVEEC